jgi:actin-related protein
LQDGSVIEVPGSVRVGSTEVIFQPCLNENGNPELSKLIWKSIQGCDMALREELMKNIILTGGTSGLTGFAQRIEKDLKEFAPSAAELCITVCEDRIESAYIGLCKIASTGSEFLMTKEQYEEKGAYEINTICI